jgi:hypothetical protein
MACLHVIDLPQLQIWMMVKKRMGGLWMESV